MIIRWSSEAADDLQRICERIEIDSPEAAARAARTMYDGWRPAERVSACRANKPPFVSLITIRFFMVPNFGPD